MGAARAKCSKIKKNVPYLADCTRNNATDSKAKINIGFFLKLLNQILDSK